MKRGFHIMFEGLDGCGKGFFVECLKQKLIKKGMNVFDADEFSKEHDHLPSIEDVKSHSIITISEPSHQGVGRLIRNEYVGKKRYYTNSAIAHSFALDRHILYQNLILPALEKGIWVLQQRGFPSSLAYQTTASSFGNDPITKQDILQIVGNQLAFKNAPDYLIIVSVNDANTVIGRLANRDKKDNSKYEVLDFQKALINAYQDVGNFLLQHNVKVINMDASKTHEISREQVEVFFENELKLKIPQKSLSEFVQ